MRRGITLLEVLIAAVLLAVGLLGAIEVMAHCAVTSARARDRSRAMLFARSKMEEILKEPTVQTGTDSGQGVDETTDYDWAAEIDQTANANLVVVTIRATNRITGQAVTLSALRRPDLSTPPADQSGTTDTTSATGTTTGGTR